MKRTLGVREYGSLTSVPKRGVGFALFPRLKKRPAKTLVIISWRKKRTLTFLLSHSLILVLGTIFYAGKEDDILAVFYLYFGVPQVNI